MKRSISVVALIELEVPADWPDELISQFVNERCFGDAGKLEACKVIMHPYQEERSTDRGVN